MAGFFLTPGRLLAAVTTFLTLSLSLVAAPTRIVLVGDSTVTDHGGWGAGFKRFVGDGAVVENAAQSGRSSKSYLDEGRWTKALALKGDYYLIQFGHNDQPGKGPARETDPATTYRANLTRYVTEARAIGAQPVLVTSLTRRNFDPKNPGRINDTLKPYADAAKAVAAELGVPVIGLHASSRAYVERLGPTGSAQFDVVKDGKADTTHLDAGGSLAFARLVVDELRTVVPALAPVLLTEPRAAEPVTVKPDAIVSPDNSGTHITVQAAIDAAPTGRKAPWLIVVKSGRYVEHVHIPADKPWITLRGESAADTIITLDRNLATLDAQGKKFSTPDSATVLIDAPDFLAENLTFENTTPREAKVQALAMYVRADRAVFRHCRFLGWQDTLRLDSPRPAHVTEPDAPRPEGNARQYLVDCYVEGHVDFIYAAGTSVFERCEIHARADGYLTAASTPQAAPFGYVFLDCKVTAGPAVEKGFYLGRPWRAHAATAFLRTEMPAQLLPAGWHNWGKVENEKTARYAEFGSTGPGANPAARVTWAKQLTAEEAAGYTVEKILSAREGWDPRKR